MERGYLALWRKIKDHPFYKQKRKFSKFEAWVDILMEAQHSEENQDVVIGNDVLICHYGESLKSLRTWASRWNWSEAAVRRYFDLLKKMNQIDKKSEGKTTRISVLNYSNYDPKRRKPDANLTQPRRKPDANLTTDNNVKNERMKELNNNTTPLPPKGKDVELKDFLLNNIPSDLRCIENKIIEYFEYRQQKPKAKRYKTTKAISGLFRDLCNCVDTGYDPATCLDIAMEREWQTPDPTYFKPEMFKSASISKSQTKQEILKKYGFQ